MSQRYSTGEIAEILSVATMIAAFALIIATKAPEWISPSGVATADAPTLSKAIR